MKTIVEINSTNYASTGNIMLNIAKKARNNNYKVITFCKASKESFKYKFEDNYYIGNRYERILSNKINIVTGLRDHLNIFGTISLVNKLKKIKPDLIHLHVMHDDFVNMGILFKYLKTSDIPVVWTFHDCCAFTGKCPYFDMVDCSKWKNGCYSCPQLKIEEKSLFFDTSKYIWSKRKKLFTSLKNLTIVTPSNWLNKLVKESFFKNYNVITINNGINLDVFKETDSNTKDLLNIKDKHLVLGVSNFWGKRKGLDVFNKLASDLDNKYQIVLVGTNPNIDKQLDEKIISIHRTYNQQELVKLYSCADVFVNPTREENFPTVNIESLACGTPVITYKTGGSHEIIDETCGFVIEKDDYSKLKERILETCENKLFSKTDCVKRARKYDMNDAFNSYVDLYNDILK